MKKNIFLLGIIFIIIILFLSLFIIFICKNKDYFKLYTGFKRYRFGDMFLGILRNSEMGEKYHLSTYPNSIVSQYMKTTKKFGDYQILWQIINKRKNNTPKNALIVHLRVGDVLEFQKCQIKNILNQKCGQEWWCSYVKDYKYFTDKIPSIQKHNLKNIILVAGSHFKLPNYTKSTEYINKIKDFFENKGFNVKLRIGNSPDDDIVFISNAKYFCPTGGGFSNVMSELVKRNNGIVF